MSDMKASDAASLVDFLESEIGNIDEYLGIAVTDPDSRQIRLTKAKTLALKKECARQGIPYVPVKTIDDLSALEMRLWDPDVMEELLSHLEDVVNQDEKVSE